MSVEAYDANIAEMVASGLDPSALERARAASIAKTAGATTWDWRALAGKARVAKERARKVRIARERRVATDAARYRATRKAKRRSPPLDRKVRKCGAIWPRAGGKLAELLTLIESRPRTTSELDERGLYADGQRLRHALWTLHRHLLVTVESHVWTRTKVMHLVRPR